MAAKVNLWIGAGLAFVVLMIGYLLTQFQISVWIEPAGSEPEAPPILEANPPPAAAPPTPLPPAAVNPAARIPQGLRVSNQTPYPIRLVLLTREAQTQADEFRRPVHWDFAPEEGSQAGLLLSLPEGNLKLNSGDVLMAFALDGSRYYWGPYVVGQTSVPTPQGQPPEWQLVLRR